MKTIYFDDKSEGEYRVLVMGVRFNSVDMCNTPCFLYWRKVKDALRVICG